MHLETRSAQASALARLMPGARLVEVSGCDVAADPARAWEYVRHGDLDGPRLVRALFGLRALPDRVRGREPAPLRMRIDDLVSTPEDPGLRGADRRPPARGGGRRDRPGLAAEHPLRARRRRGGVRRLRHARIRAGGLGAPRGAPPGRRRPRRGRGARRRHRPGFVAALPPLLRPGRPRLPARAPLAPPWHRARPRARAPSRRRPPAGRRGPGDPRGDGGRAARADLALARADGPRARRASTRSTSSTTAAPAARASWTRLSPTSTWATCSPPTRAATASRCSTSTRAGRSCWGASTTPRRAGSSPSATRAPAGTGRPPGPSRSSRCRPPAPA